jgi:hypothetical protein
VSHAQAEVLEAYLAYWRMVDRVNNPPNPADPEIAQRTTGDELVFLIQRLQTNETNHIVIRAPEGSRSRHRPEIVDLSSDRATIRDCAIDDLVVSNQQTGEILDDDLVTILVSSVMVREQGVWKVSQAELGAKTPGESNCGL